MAMTMATVTWAAAAEVIITDGAEDAVITMAGPADIIATVIDTAAGEHFWVISGAIGVAGGYCNSADGARTTGSCQ